ncbi:glycoside hydrolase family 127 protein [Cellulomonas telluris]|uniref:glycoside hydrolase family 127 protein n=1 Tax=Cellulomonas telluris TaxID=2306636 RepID=UPI0010A86C19|nr:beta-L-arabinofuranosidase domain-containing protein [Cellulomonas telluris]
MTATTPARRPGGPLRPADLRDVRIDDAFWAPRRETVRTTTLPQQERQLRTVGQLEALRLQWREGDPREPHVFWESDVAKWIEAASYALATQPDPALEASVDEAIALLADAQQPDGYLNVYFTVVRPGQRFTDLRDAHELYCLGHLIEAAVAHHRATGRTTLLDVVRRYADLVAQELGPGGALEGGYDGHQEIELALVKLARATGERRYLDLARRMLDARGTQPYWFEVEEVRRGTPGYFGSHFPDRTEQAQRYREYNQSHLPVREQQEVVGHAVRAMYMLSAMTDLAAEDGDDDLLAACGRLWDSTTGTKMYVTGGLGSDPSIEGFGAPYDLPDRDGYAETCAAIGLVMWAQRMTNVTGDGRYADVLERALYNGVLAGASADGTCYFYGNPLASDGDVHRHEWFGVACCPPNLARLLTSLEQYAYADADDELAVHLHVAGSVRTRAGGGACVDVGTRYPDDGAVRLTVAPEVPGAAWTLAVRVPAWSARTSLTVNGDPVPVADVLDRGYVRLHRTWAAGDVVELGLDVRPRRVWADPRVASATGRVALQRGPVVHCLEGVDHDVPVRALLLPRDAALGLEPEPVSGLAAVVADGLAEPDPPEGRPLYREEPPAREATRVRAVPYFAWGNRGQGTMAVWVREA